MAVDPLLIERIYEAAALPDRWPAALQTIADRATAKGAVFVTQSPAQISWLASPRIEGDVADYMAAGWGADPGRVRDLFTEQYPGFRAETDYHPVEKIERMPVHADFLAPRGFFGGVGTVLQGARDDALHMALEGFRSHEAAGSALPFLDGLRPALGRALSLTAHLRDAHGANAVAALDLAGVAAAVVSSDGRLRATNDRFVKRLGARLIDRPTGLRFTDRFLQTRFAEALAVMGAGAGVRSIAVAASEDRQACAIHLLPLKRGARDVFGWDGVLMLLAEAANASVPGADLLRLLFDLTPTEARLTRHLVEGRTPAETAKLMRITDATARTHLRRIFARTGVRRQAELVRLLLGLGGPTLI